MTDPVERVVLRLESSGWGQVIEQWFLDRQVGRPGRPLSPAGVERAVNAYLSMLAIDAVEALDEA